MQVVNFILQTMDHGNSVMRRICLQSSMTALNEVVRVFPMVALSDTSTRLAVGDAIGDINSSFIRVYDMQRYQISFLVFSLFILLLLLLLFSFYILRHKRATFLVCLFVCF